MGKGTHHLVLPSWPRLQARDGDKAGRTLPAPPSATPEVPSSLRTSRSRPPRFAVGTAEAETQDEGGARRAPSWDVGKGFFGNETTRRARHPPPRTSPHGPPASGSFCVARDALSHRRGTSPFGDPASPTGEGKKNPTKTPQTTQTTPWNHLEGAQRHGHRPKATWADSAGSLSRPDRTLPAVARGTSKARAWLRDTPRKHRSGGALEKGGRWP